MNKHLPGITAGIHTNDRYNSIIIRRGELASLKVTTREALALADLLVDLVEQEEQS